MRLALFEPDIPQNTGALLRLAACFGVAVDLIRHRQLQQDAADGVVLVQRRDQLSTSS